MEVFENFGIGPPDSTPPAGRRITLTQEAKRRAARRGNWAAMPLAMLMTFAVVITHYWGLLLVFVPLLALVNLTTWLFFLRVERHAVQEALDQEAMLQEAKQQARAMLYRPEGYE